MCPAAGNNETKSINLMNLLMNMLATNVWGFFRGIFAKNSLNPNSASGMGSWVESELPSNPSLPRMRSSDRSLSLPLRLETLDAELAEFERMLPNASVDDIFETPETNF